MDHASVGWCMDCTSGLCRPGSPSDLIHTLRMLDLGLHFGSLLKGTDDESIRKAFEKIDTNKNGWLEKDEIEAVMHECNPAGAHHPNAH